MSSSGLSVIWLSVRTENGRGFHFTFPIALAVFRELLDSLKDLAEFVCLFAPEAPETGSRVSVRGIRDFLELLLALTGSLNAERPYELVNVEASNNVKVSIKIR